MMLIPSRTPISDVGSVGEEGVRLMTSMSVSPSRCLLKGASGQAPRRVFVVALADGDSMVAFCDGSRTAENSRGMERVRQVAINAKRGRLCEIIVDEQLRPSIEQTVEWDAVGGHTLAHIIRGSAAIGICYNFWIGRTPQSK